MLNRCSLFEHTTFYVFWLRCFQLITPCQFMDMYWFSLTQWGHIIFAQVTIFSKFVLMGMSCHLPSLSKPTDPDHNSYEWDTPIIIIFLALIKVYWSVLFSSFEIQDWGRSFEIWLVSKTIICFVISTHKWDTTYLIKQEAWDTFNVIFWVEPKKN